MNIQSYGAAVYLIGTQIWELEQISMQIDVKRF